jgi:ADP-ribosylglycohydrolase
MPYPTLSRCVGCLLGGALGDALGYPIEFDGPGSKLVALHGPSAPPRLRFHAASTGRISDDTQMTLFTAEGLIRAHLAGEANPIRFLLAAYQRWYATQAMRPRGTSPPPPPQGHGLLLADARLYARRAPGNTCLSALAASFMGRPLPSLESPPNDSKGCGGVMRSAPFGLFAASAEEAFEQARDAALLTHGHPSGYLSSAYFAALIFELSRGTPAQAGLDRADALLAGAAGAAELRTLVDQVRPMLGHGLPSIETIERLGGGWTGEEALGIAIACAFGARQDDPRHVTEALWRSVVHAGDSDSTGSLTGNLLGAMFGVEALPPGWLDELELGDLIERLGADLWAARADPTQLETSAYPLA